MQAIDWRAWLRQYGVPLLIIVGAEVVLLWLATHGVLANDEGFALLFLLVVLPGLGLLCGLLFRPPHVWVVLSLFVVVQPIISIIVNDPAGPAPLNRPDPLSTFLMQVLSGVPMLVTMWLGRRQARLWLERSHLGRHQGPHAPAS